MLLYNANVYFDEAIECNSRKTGEWLYLLNGEIDATFKSKDLLICVTEMKKNRLGIVILVKNYLTDEVYLKSEVAKAVMCGLQGKTIQKIDLREITIIQCASLINKYSIKHFQKDSVATRIQELLPDNTTLPFRCGVEFWEEIIKVPKRTNFRTKAKKIKANEILMDEMTRIYSDNHPKQYRGIPVHYKISATSEKIAKEIVYVLMQGLYANSRILSKRMTYIKFKSTHEYMDITIDKLFKLGAGGCIVIDMFENPSMQTTGLWDRNDDWSFFDSDDETETDGGGFDWWQPNSSDAIKSFASKIEKKSDETLFFIIENARDTWKSERLVEALNEKINIIEIKEGLNGKLAQQLYGSMIDKAGLVEFNNNEKVFKEGQYYSEEDVAARFRKFSQQCMTDKVYVEYSKEKRVKEKTDNPKKSSRDELQSLIGLDSVKKIVDNIISVHKVNEMRKAYSSQDNLLSKHMLFTGNPGTAKTTVARLMAQIMKEEGLLKTGRFVECGRADLVGQFVGWTAVQVKEMFKKARGGVLFIDEAYSLVDDCNNFGDEAINTIVAEMENMRDDIIVIFAGYPDKMNAFIDKNEGLRSRVSHHINFPDYTPNELLEILEKLANDRDFILNASAKEKAYGIFCEICGESDFGNGRFARNMLEHAIFRQAARITSIPKDEVSKEQLFELTEEDFRYENSMLHEKRNKVIGFRV